VLPHLAPAVRTGRNHRSGLTIFRTPLTARESPRRVIFAAVTAALCGCLAGCVGVPNTLGPDRQTARVNAESLFDALAKRFDNVQRTPKFAQARSKLGRYALSPSGVFRDTSVWTAVGTDSTRTLTLSGSHSGSSYVFNARPGVPIPSATGDSRHVIRLRRRGESEYRWDTSVDHAIGNVHPNDVARALTVYLTSVERSPALGVRADTRSLLPRSTRVLGELFTLDTVAVTALSDGSKSVMARATMDPRRIEKARPNFAKYLQKYVEPARYRIRLHDGAGVVWFDAAGSDNRFTVAYRVRNGELVAGAGNGRPMPDSLKITVDFSAKFMIFRVGISKLVGDFTFVRSADERGWMMRFTREPDWQFPLAVNHFIRTSLRHPFEGNGITLRITVRDRLGPQTLLSREAGGAVQESAIVRWLGGLGSSAMSDFAGKAEVEENRYVYEVLSALRLDFAAALGAGE
jgi:hypothetical protein